MASEGLRAYASSAHVSHARVTEHMCHDMQAITEDTAEKLQKAASQADATSAAASPAAVTASPSLVLDDGTMHCPTSSALFQVSHLCFCQLCLEPLLTCSMCSL